MIINKTTNWDMGVKGKNGKAVLVICLCARSRRQTKYLSDSQFQSSVLEEEDCKPDYQ